jgi:PAS domain-containing protein
LVIGGLIGLSSSKTKKQLIDELGQMQQRISELKVVEAELKESNELFQTLFYSSPVGIYIVQDGLFRIVGHQFAQIADYNEDELIGTPVLDIVFPRTGTWLPRMAPRCYGESVLWGMSSGS